MFNKILALLCLSFSVTAQVTIEFKIKPGSGNTLNGSVEICNNSGSALPAGYYMDFYWPNFNIVDLTSQPGTVVYPGDGILRMQFNAAWMLPAAGACRSHSVNSTSTYNNPFLFPPYGIDSNGDTVEVVVTDPQWIPKTGQNEPQEFYINQECFIPSPDQYCLGEARFEEWNRLADVRIPVNRKGWALAAAHSHRLFTNMMGCEVTSLNFVMATSMIEGRMGCDANAQPPAGDAHPLTYESHITTDGCLQIRPLGYLQTQDFYPHLFANTPKASITDGDNFITSALTKTLYDYTSFTFWDQYFCYPDVREFFCNLNDPYGADAIFGYTYHKGWNNTDFQKVFVDDRATWQNADNIADLLSTHHPDIHGGYAERVRNNIMRLENNFSVDPSLNYSTAQDNWDPSTYQHYGCYNEAFTWQDVSDYIDEALRVFITANETRVKTAAQDAFNMIAVGGEVNFQDIGPVIDAIVLNIPVPSANQGMTGKYFSQAETCIKPGIKIHSYDEICAGQDAELLVYLMGQPPFNYTIQGPDGTIYSRSGIGISTDVLNVNQPGEYKIISMSDANGDLDLKCNTARTEIQNAGDATAAWDKSRYDAADDCYQGDLELLLTGSGPWKVTYSKNGGPDRVLSIPSGFSSYTVETPNEGDTYVLKSMVAGGCNSNLNDEITFCSSTQACVAPQAIVSVTDDTICSGDSTQINIDFVGVQPFSLVYSLNGNATKVENIMAWNYSINISESVNFRIDTLWDNQCMNDTLVDPATVTVVNPLQVDLGPDVFSCGDEVSLQVDSIFTDYTWVSHSGDDPSLLANQNGDYIINVIDSNGCASADTVNVQLGALPSVDIGDSIFVCDANLPFEIRNQGDQVDQYLWQDGSTDSVYQVISEGLFWLEINSGGCTARDSVMVMIQNNLDVDIGPDQVICPGGSAVFNANVTAQQFEWNGTIGQDTFATNLPGDVVLKVTDSYGCSGSDTARVDVENNLELDIDAQAAFCQGDSVRIGEASSRSGVIYSWASGENASEIYVDASGTYVLTIDSAGCSISDTVIVDQSASPQPVLGNDTAFCSGQDINLLISPSQSYASYQWLQDASGNDSAYMVNQTGVYVVEVENDKGCLGRDTLEVSEANATPFSLSTVDTTICPGQALVLTVPQEIQSVGGNWQWGDGANDLQLQLNSLQNDSLVHLTFWNNTGCTSKDSIQILVRNEIPVQLSSDTACVGDNVVFSAPNFGAGFSYEWNNDPSLTTNSLSFENIQLSDAGSIHLRVESPLGCSGDTAVELLVFDVPVPWIENDTVCEGESVVFQSNVLGDYLWSNGTVGSMLQILNTTLADAQEYTLEVTNSMGCVGRDTMMLVVNEIPEIEIVQPQMACEGAFVDLFTVASNNLPVRWSTNDTTDMLRISSPGEYVASVSDKGCVASDTVEVEFLERPEVYLPEDSVICLGTEWYISPTNTLDYSVVDFEWSTNETTEGIVVESPGYYWLEVTNGACSDRDSVWVGQSSAPVRPFGKDTTLCVDEVDMLSLDAGRVNHILWNDGDTNQVKQVQHAGIYEVYLENEHGCYAEYAIDVISDCPSAVWVPNAFTPNDDGLNESLVIMGRGVELVELQVYNRWGELIWEGNQIGQEWDGTYLGNKVQQDVYVYRLVYEYYTVEGYLKEKEKFGTITVFIE